jgi:hypothetical protein
MKPLTNEDVKRIKAGLLCFGIKIDGSALEKIKDTHSYFFDKGFVHAVNMRLFDFNVCVSAAERFCERSPYILVSDGRTFYLEEGGERLAAVKLFDPLPKTGTIIDALGKPHSPECISLWPSLVCCYDSPELKCKFCSIKSPDGRQVPSAGEVVSSLKKLYESEDGYSLNIGGGTYKNPDYAAKYILDIVKGVRGFTDKPVSIEIAPPSDLSLIDKLFEAGVSSVIINLEICDDGLRKEICPGKFGISYNRYYETYEHAVKVFGRGKVSCVLIVGIQGNDDVKRECARLTDIGVIPTLIPFKPMDECEYNEKPVTNPEALLDVSEHLARLLIAKGLNPAKQEGCTKCGGCSLETNCCAKASAYNYSD